MTLVYLSVQVRQNSRALVLSGLADITSQWHQCGRELPPAALEEQEEVLASIVRARMEIPGMAEWWCRNTVDYDPPFVKWVEEIRRSA